MSRFTFTFCFLQTFSFHFLTCFILCFYFLCAHEHVLLWNVHCTKCTKINYYYYYYYYYYCCCCYYYYGQQWREEEQKQFGIIYCLLVCLFEWHQVINKQKILDTNQACVGCTNSLVAIVWPDTMGIMDFQWEEARTTWPFSGMECPFKNKREREHCFHSMLD